MLTPLDETGEPDLEKVEQLVELFVSEQLDGLYVTGSTGQWPLLTADARRAVVDRVLKTSAGRIPVIVHVGSTATDEAVAHARHAAERNADGVSSVAPIYYPASTDVVFEHYRRIGAATDCPLFVYHLSVVNTLRIKAAEYVDRLMELPNIAGMKITDGDLYQFGLIHAHAKDRLLLFAGADELLCHAPLSGACGAIGTFYNLWGPVCRRARAASVEGRFDAALRFMQTFQRVLEEVLATGSFSFLRVAMQIKYGIDVGPFKAPLGIADQPWNPDRVEKLIAEVDNWT